MAPDEFVSLTELGKYFGVSNQKCGRWLSDLGLRVVGGSPTPKAFDEGLPKKTPTGHGSDDGFFYTWHVIKTFNLLVGAGHKPVTPLTPGSAERESYKDSEETQQALIGPFDLHRSGDSSLIVNGEGKAILCAIDSDVAHFVTKMLGLAYSVGAKSMNRSEGNE